jgi:hypothetical protein
MTTGRAVVTTASAVEDRTHDRTATWTVLAALMVLAAVIHLPFHFGSSFGEQDTARLVNDALIWSKAGIRSESLSEYRFYVSPGYIWLAGQVHRAAETPTATTFYLNTLNTAGIIAIVVPLFLLFRRLIGEPGAIVATALLSIVPSFWQAGLYGFPTLLALFFLVCALLVYDRYLTNERRFASLAAVTALLTCSVLLKADVYLATCVFLPLMLHRARLTRKELMLGAVVLLVPVAVTFGLARLLLADSPNTVEYMAAWNSQYRPYPGRFFSRAGILGLLKSMGAFTVPLFAISIAYLIVGRRWSLVVMLCFWAAAPLAFWVFREGDSARHHLPASLPMSIAIGAFLAGVPFLAGWRRFAVLGALVTANYFWFPPSDSTYVTSGNLIASSRLIETRVAGYHDAARQYADVDAEHKVIFGTSTNPYVDYEILARAESVESVTRHAPYGFDSIEIRYTLHGRPRRSTSVRIGRGEIPAAAAAYSGAGYRVYSMEYDLNARREQRPAALNEYQPD